MEANRDKEIRDIKKIVKQLNDIHYPINATVYSHGKQWSMRNIAFWESLKEREAGLLEALTSPKNVIT